MGDEGEVVHKFSLKIHQQSPHKSGMVVSLSFSDWAIFVDMVSLSTCSCLDSFEGGHS